MHKHNKKLLIFIIVAFALTVLALGMRALQNDEPPQTLKLTEAQNIAKQSCPLQSGDTIYEEGVFEEATQAWVFDITSETMLGDCLTVCLVNAQTGVISSELRCEDK